MDRRGELLEVIRSVRNRWRQRLALRRSRVPSAHFSADIDLATAIFLEQRKALAVLVRVENRHSCG